MKEIPAPMIVNIGGIFIYSENPEKLAKWYKKHLGLDYEHTAGHAAYYLSLPYIDKGKKTENYIVWSILNAKNRPVLKEHLFTVNYRVYDIEQVVSHLRKQGLEVKGIETHDEGKFAWLNDPENNKIELWEDTQSKAAEI